MTTITCPLWGWDDGKPEEVMSFDSFTAVGQYLEFLNSNDSIGRDVPDYDHFTDDQGIRIRLVISMYEVLQITILDSTPLEEEVFSLKAAKKRFFAQQEAKARRRKWWQRSRGA